MAAGNKPIFVAGINNKGTAWNSADVSLTSKDIFVAGTNGSRIFAVSATSTYATALDMRLYTNDGTTAWLIGTETVAINAGNNGGTASQNLFSLSYLPSLNSDGSLTLPTGWKLQASNGTAMAAGTVTLVSLGGDY